MELDEAEYAHSRSVVAITCATLFSVIVLTAGSIFSLSVLTTIGTVSLIASAALPMIAHATKTVIDDDDDDEDYDEVCNDPSALIPKAREAIHEHFEKVYDLHIKINEARNKV